VTGRVIVHRRFGGAPEALVARLRPAAAKTRPTEASEASWPIKSSWKTWRIERPGFRITRFLAAIPHRPWGAEEELKAGRHRHLLEDNPASG